MCFDSVEEMTMVMTRYYSPKPILSIQECEELMAIHKAMACCGYRPHLYAASLENIALSCPLLLPPLVQARTKAWQLAERTFGREFETYVEFTSLLSWDAGSDIGWHSDSGRDYLSQRYISLIVYLNSQGGGDHEGEGFTGGDLEFKEPDLLLRPKQGHIVAFLSDGQNEHRVTEVTSGERFTLTMWLTLRPEHREDDRVLRVLRKNPLPLSPQLHSFDLKSLICSFPELPIEMYLEGSKDIRCKRMPALTLTLGSDGHFQTRVASIYHHLQYFLASHQVEDYLLNCLSRLQTLVSTSIATGFLCEEPAE